MSNLLPDGEDIRRAVKWVSTNIQEDPDKAVNKLIQDAIFKFDLSPLDADFLIGFFSSHSKK